MPLIIETLSWTMIPSDRLTVLRSLACISSGNTTATSDS
jgi:hypothetical protein